MNTPGSIESAIRRLTIAMWIVAALVAVNIGVSLFDFRLRPVIVSPFAGIPSSPTIIPPTLPTATIEMETRYNDFHDWPLQKQIDEASVIAVARYNKQGDRYKTVISEILKKAPGTTFYYKVGDEYDRIGVHSRENTVYGDGQIIFFTGSPATMRYACSFEGDRIAAFGDMPFDDLRKIMKSAASKSDLSDGK